MIPFTFETQVALTLGMLSKLAAVVIYAPVFLVPGVFIALIGGFLSQLYLKAQLSVKRETSNAKSPVIETLGNAVASLGWSIKSRFRTTSLITVYHSVCQSLRGTTRVQAAIDAPHRSVCQSISHAQQPQ